MRIGRILVPTDLSDASLPALALADGLARALGAELMLCFVVEAMYTTGDLLGAATMTSLVAAQRRRARAHLAREAARLGRGLRVRTVIRTGKAAAAIVATAKSVSADLIIIGTHGRSALSHLLLGSVAERVVRTANCPVLTVRSAPKRDAARRPRSLRGSPEGLRRASGATLI